MPDAYSPPMRIAPAATLAGLLSFFPPAAGQPAPGGGQPIHLDQLPPPLRLGIRAESVLRKLPVHSTVVLVPDTNSYIEAIGRWNLQARFPVLIDDGSPAAAEDIARFVRAFSPEHVVRWSHPGERPLEGAAIQEAVDLAVAHAWQPAADALDEAAVARARWHELGLTPAGVVVADTSDEAWTAALALAAGRGQPIAWVNAPAGVNRAMKPADADALEAALETACAGWGYVWPNLGDDLDAVTLCLNSPVRLEAGEKDWVAVTDRIGRRFEAGRDAGRWAWAGQIFGDQPRAAYSAMCSLFLRPSSAWLFEGYTGGPPWSEFSETQAAAVLREAGIEPTVLNGAIGLGAQEWRHAAAHPIDAGLVCVNTKGTRDFFELGDSRCQPGDIPFLERPAMVYFVHSWSANAPGNRTTVAGRWLERGAYAYLGSVQEPLLSAFAPTPQMASRLVNGGAWGACVRLDFAPLWKLAVFGDPLATIGTALGPWPARTTSPLPLIDTIDVSDGLKELLTQKQYPQAARTLVLLGRDDDAARLALGVLTDEPDKFDSALAAEVILPLFRTGRSDAMLRAFVQLDAQHRADGVIRDALWNALSPGLAVNADAAQVAALSENLREDQLSRDAIDLAGAIERVRGNGAGQAFLMSVRQRATDKRDQADLDKALGIQDSRPRPPRARPGGRK